MTTFVMIGSGWRAQMFLAVARELDDVDCVGVVVRTPRDLELRTFVSLDACLADVRPDFVLTATPWSVTPDVIADAVRRGIPVLAETPPAPDLDGLRDLWSAVGESGLVQVAEQYLMMPSHAARAAVVASGAIGIPSQVQVSSTQKYHAVSLIRGLLGVGREPVTVRATRFVAPLISPLSRAGWTDDDDTHPTTTTIATLDFGDGRSGVYDFTEQQTRNQLRFRRLSVRGSVGELYDDEVVQMTGPRTLVRSPLVRRQTGHDLDLIGYDTEHISLGSEVLYRNPLPSASVDGRGDRDGDPAGAYGDLGARRGPRAVPLGRRSAGPADRPGHRGSRRPRRPRDNVAPSLDLTRIRRGPQENFEETNPIPHLNRTHRTVQPTRASSRSDTASRQ